MTAALTALAMLAFAANSLLARLALGDGGIDAASFTLIRLGAGAVALAGWMLWRRGQGVLCPMPGNWISGLCLLLYAALFSFAYLRLGAATGALVLFASVQASMVVGALLRADRPTAVEAVGLALAFGAFVYLVLPGLQRPDPLGSALMVGAGIAWGAYSLRGRGLDDPLGETTGNFVRATALALLPGLVLFAHHATGAGVGLALVSGVVTSGIGYALWYRALPLLSTTLAAAVQLTVPVLAALGGVLFLSEVPGVRLAVASTCILGGVGVAILGRR